MATDTRTNRPRSLWTPAGRLAVFMLGAASIWCLLADFYGLCSMRAFTLWVLIPATAILVALAVMDRLGGDGRLYRGVVIGSVAGLVAALAYDLFRVPFVFAKDLGIEHVVPQMPLFKVFPRFGAMILGQAVEQPAYSLAAHLLGWTYHFSNGVTFGIMYAAAVGEPSRRHWAWAVLMAVGIELAMLLTPYASFFGIGLSALFIGVTVCAHLVFGVVLGLVARRQGRAWPILA